MFKDIFGEGPQIKILDFLASHPNIDYSLSEIAKYSQVSRPTVYKLKDIFLKKELIIQTREQGNSKLYKLNFDNELIKMILKFDFEKIMKVEDIETQELVKKNSSMPVKSDQDLSKNKASMPHLRIR